jgi:hypothetical protein
MDVPERFRAKIDRAGELITTVHGEIAVYHESDPYTFREETLSDPPRMVLYVESLREPPLRLGVLMGDFVHNLRSALDHLVWQLALTNAAEPSTRLQFPIYVKSPKDWASIAADRLKDVPPAAVEIIERLQPYHMENPTHAATAVIQALSNEDKHRVILETISAPVEPDMSSFDAQGNMDIAEDLEVEVPWGVPLGVGDVAATIYYTPIGPHPRLHLTGTLPVEVGFGSIGFRASMMPGLAGEVVRHIRRFDRFFS